MKMTKYTHSSIFEDIYPRVKIKSFYTKAFICYFHDHFIVNTLKYKSLIDTNLLVYISYLLACFIELISQKCEEYRRPYVKINFNEELIDYSKSNTAVKY